MQHILIVEDDKALGQGISLALRSDTLAFTRAETLCAARQAMAGQAFDLVLLDENLPDGSGLDLLIELRQAGATPVILLTANDLETDVVAGLSLGADDYITKPFSLAVLRARVEVQLRRGSVEKPDVFRLDGYEFDFQRMEFRQEGRPIVLSGTEQKLLRLLVENRGATLSRERLLDRIWTDGAAYVEENALSVAINRLRSKLGDKPHIKTVYGLGYTWAVAP